MKLETYDVFHHHHLFALEDFVVTLVIEVGTVDCKSEDAVLLLSLYLPMMSKNVI